MGTVFGQRGHVNQIRQNISKRISAKVSAIKKGLNMQLIIFIINQIKTLLECHSVTGLQKCTIIKMLH